jgi:hypothetical protein
MADQSDRDTPQPGFLQQAFTRITGGLVVIVVLWIVFHWLLGSGSKWNNPTETPSVANRNPAPVASPGAESVTAAITQQEVRAQAQVRIARFRAQSRELLATLTDLDTAIGLWETRTHEMASSDTGKMIAADPDRLLRYRALADQHRAGRELGDRIRASLKTLSGPVDEAEQHPESIWSPDKCNAELEAMGIEARKALADYKDSLGAVDDLVRQATRIGKTAAVSLSQAIDELAAQRAQAHALELKRIDDEAQRAKELDEIAQKKELVRLAAIARNPDALKLLSFTGLSGEGEVWPAALFAKAYPEIQTFHVYATNIIRNRQGPLGVDQEYARCDTLAQQQFHVSLHELFRIVVCSEAAQKQMPDNVALAAKIKDLQNKGQGAVAVQYAEVLNAAPKLPPAKYP